jgi:phosphoenolpyruvate---glycerone phosphotransferase subunit DhaL
MSNILSGADVVAAVQRVSRTLVDQRDYLTSLDQAMGDGDMGITMGRIGEALLEYAAANPIDDIGKYLFQVGTAVNKAAPSTMGTLTAGALMSAAKTVRDKTELEPADLVAILRAADEGIQSRGKAKPGDKTIVDALHPASEAFAAAIDAGAGVQAAAAAAIAAAEAGRDSVTPLRSKVGRASWVGERTEGKVDPGCAMFVLALKALAGN